MYRTLKTLILPVLAVSLILSFSGCNESNTTADAEQTSNSDMVIIEVAEQPAVCGWLDIVLPSSPVAMTEFNSDLWILTTDGFVMKWAPETKDWHVVQSELSSSTAFDIAASELGVAVISLAKVTVFSDDIVTEIDFSGVTPPIEICATDDSFLVLYSDGSVDLIQENSLENILGATEKVPAGSLCCEDATVAWMNDDNSVAVLNLEQSLLTEVTLPDSSVNIDVFNGEILAGTQSAVFALNSSSGDWEERFSGTLLGNGLLLTDNGFTRLVSDETIAAPQPMVPENCYALNDGTVWTMADGGIAVWASIGEVETRFSDAEVQMLRYQVAGQTGGGSADNPSINDSEVSMGGVFRIYESVSSRPDPFSEFPLTSRDLRRELADLTIEELHIVGITLDPSGGDQAMVEDANGVAYILFEGTELRNNTHIAEITSNEVIVVQEVTVGSSDDSGGSTTIPTIFSMRLHEEGGL